jgi:hypothetical protein
MREGIGVEVSAAERARLRAFVADRNSRRKHGRAPIVLTDGRRLGTHEIMCPAGGGAGSVARQDAALAHPTLPSNVQERWVALTFGDPAGRGDALDGPDDSESGRHQLYWLD